MRNYIYIFIIILVSIFACSQQPIISDQEQNHISIIDSLKYVKNLPDENYYPTGGTVYSKILKKGKDITPFLIDKIDDTTNSKYIYADTFTYKVGDIAVNLLDDLYTDDEFPIRSILENEFYKNENVSDYQYVVIYQKAFFLNSKKGNLENRKRFKKAVAMWFSNRK